MGALWVWVGVDMVNLGLNPDLLRAIPNELALWLASLGRELFVTPCSPGAENGFNSFDGRNEVMSDRPRRELA
ncbi:hypothetical protein OOU_Y34scaffold00542g47 [Pyricularia oryzae Y34]|uniref:Uncharacterized protein n=1 Tax=Pyricularia oryzae (strain Y34) TaxID=1143189 RepID=A0AA97NXV1_PYRO3|nr:hypothetical protein OOU_Y34scaffold00542g47 [Pyricularia oryzae Y34]